MNREFLEKTLRDLQKLVLPSAHSIISIIKEAKEVFAREKNVLYIEGDTAVVGDIHGQFFDFLNILDLIGDGKKILFLGDYVDRGYNSVELLTYLAILKILNPNDIFLLRGNHENRSQTIVYGFYEECTQKYDHAIYWMFCELFEHLPLVSIVNKSYFCVHGGISPGLTLDWIESRNRAQEYGDFSCVLWGDPVDDVDEFSVSQRGAGFLYGKKAVDSFLNEVNCQYLVRSHQLVANGFEVKFNGKCITVWSAPNYCYRCKNLASFMVIKEKNHDFTTFEAVKEQYRC